MKKTTKKLLADSCLLVGGVLIGFGLGLIGAFIVCDIKSYSEAMNYLPGLSLLFGAALFTIGIHEHGYGRDPDKDEH